jgi:hypothetical protein
MLTTPVVSVTTPSLLAQGMPFSAMPTAYNTGYLKHEQIATNAYTCLYCVYTSGGRLIMSGMQSMEWHQTHVVDIIQLTPFLTLL